MDADDPTQDEDDARLAPPTAAELAAEASRALRGLLEANAEAVPYLPGGASGEGRRANGGQGQERGQVQGQERERERERDDTPEPATARIPGTASLRPGSSLDARPSSLDARPSSFDACDLPALEAIVATCTRCDLHGTRRQTVFGEGPEGCAVMFVGDGPGGEEDVQGRPFVGPAGQLLDKIIAAMHLSREVCYMANVVKCRPPEDAAPTAAQSQACRTHLEGQIARVRPKVIVALGAVAGAMLTGTSESVVRLRGRWHRWSTEQGDIPVIVTYHPAALLRDDKLKRPVWEDMQKVMARLKAG